MLIIKLTLYGFEMGKFQLFFYHKSPRQNGQKNFHCTIFGCDVIFPLYFQQFTTQFRVRSYTKHDFQIAVLKQLIKSPFLKDSQLKKSRKLFPNKGMLFLSCTISKILHIFLNDILPIKGDFNTKYQKA